MTETLASAAERFIEHKRAHGRKYHSEARELALLVRFAAEHGVSCLSELTPALLEDLLASRPRPHPRASIICSASCGARWTGPSPGSC
jgi:hypothetical protein